MAVSTDLIVLQYSPCQDAFHRETLQDLIVNNFKSMALNTEPNYLVVGVFSDHVACDQGYIKILPFIERIKEMKQVDISRFTYSDLQKMINP